MPVELNFDKGDGLLPAIIQDAKTGKVLMLGFMNKEALEQTLQTGKVHFYSRTRKKLWMKGETSGHVLEVLDIYIDCDADTLLIKVNPKGPVCHEGYLSCFYRTLRKDGELTIVEEKLFQPEEVYGKGA
ncbi:phosphoribosyl-AMP cyclohydrolase [Caldimicrobium thiodismutans]|uniref:Phosphoribosyl-AMP cyclohydrolase n=1 Tax=Caldimicrobium thiodismutans TaxID=1653476 RepID=A0A0U4W535_9BACT|nr:phosphoribosyl-AMP cyclohydrolase [Caldimicrobium thiodismutans]BAU24170.1 phosphoribosyl-AMP cyclohydrolase [Caldimicrobium thiodismutans]